MTLNKLNETLQPTIEYLSDKAEINGFIELDDIFEIMPDIPLNHDDIDQIIDILEGQGIDLIIDTPRGTTTLEIEPDLNKVDLSGIASEDTVSLYLREMAQVPLLTKEEELNISKRIEAGRIALVGYQNVNDNGNWRKKRELENIITDGMNARDHLIRANTRLVVSIAKRYLGQGLSLLDLIQEGNLGLMKSIDKYDYHRGFRFSTYATWWIRQTITRAIADYSRTIRVPVHMTDQIRALRKTAIKLEQELERPPTNIELAEAMDIALKRVDFIKDVERLPISLEAPVNNEDDSDFGSFIEDSTTPTPSEIAYAKLLKERLTEVLSTLSPREARIIRLRYGIDYTRTYTLEEVGHKMGLTRERIRQIEGKALKRLRHPCRSRQLLDYL